MSIEVLLVQVLVLAFTGALWWIARRDLSARVPPPVLPTETAEIAELEQLCTTLATLVTSLTRRLEAVERQSTERQAVASVPAASQAVLHLERPGPEKIEPGDLEVEVPRFDPPSFGPPSFGPRGHLEPTEPRGPAEPVADPRYVPVYALLEAGVSDPVEIARQTGLGRGEVDLILSLRDRRAF